MSAIEAIDLIKRFGSINALNGISFQVNKGEIFINSNAGAAIDRPDCLVCFRCQEVCPNGSFQYGKITAQREEAE